MAPRIEVPGEPQFEMPSKSEQALAAIHQQLQQLAVGINTLAGQLDIGLRLGSGQMSKHEVKVKFEEHDRQVRAQMKVSDMLGAADLDDPAMD